MLQFDGKEDSKRFSHVYEEVLMSGKKDEEKAARVLAHLKLRYSYNTSAMLRTRMVPWKKSCRS